MKCYSTFDWYNSFSLLPTTHNQLLTTTPQLQVQLTFASRLFVAQISFRTSPTESSDIFVRMAFIPPTKSLKVRFEVTSSTTEEDRT